MKRQLGISLAAAVLALPALADELNYRNNIRPLIEAKCIECHGKDSPPLAEFELDIEKYKKETQGPRLSSYPELLQLIGWPDNGAIMRRLDDGTNTPDKKPGNMYRKLGETDAERAANLKIFKEWIGEGAWNLNRWQKRGDVPAITKEQMDKLRVKY